RSGSRNTSAVELARSLLQSVDNNLAMLARLKVEDLTRFHGLGEAKALSIIAALELGLRRRVAQMPEKQSVTSSEQAFELLYPNLADRQYEEFWVLFLNRANQKISVLSVSDGGQAGTVVDPKRVFKTALEQSAAYIILCHNHPSGQLKPSDADITLTRKLKEAGIILDIRVLDHLIIGDDKYYSFADNGLM
ncbi:MAG: DNA repair protein RadC, partial [Lentimicrobiaceae bacterium]|nr:DNA repair protein RadC [Lentimicrobiaceae bacterium]